MAPCIGKKIQRFCEHKAIYLSMIRIRGASGFLVIGAQKGGTTALWYNLRRHPDIEMSPNFWSTFESTGEINRKEARFFDFNYRNSALWHKKIFNNCRIQGKATPNYLHSTFCHPRMLDLLPNAKLILLLRNSVARAVSSFNHQKQEGQSWRKYSPGLTFEENFLNEQRRGFDKGLVPMGFYIDLIDNLLRYYPREQLFILISERLRNNPIENYRSLYEYFGVRNVDMSYEEVRRRDYDWEPSAQMCDVPYQLYKPYNERLFEFLGEEV